MVPACGSQSGGLGSLPEKVLFGTGSQRGRVVASEQEAGAKTEVPACPRSPGSSQSSGQGRERAGRRGGGSAVGLVGSEGQSGWWEPQSVG